jgi:hypothetical protein
MYDAFFVLFCYCSFFCLLVHPFLFLFIPYFNVKEVCGWWHYFAKCKFLHNFFIVEKNKKIAKTMKQLKQINKGRDGVNVKTKC